MADAVVVDAPGLPAAERLADALDGCGTWSALAAAAEARATTPAGLPVVVLPEVGGFAPGSSAAADPALVEALIDALHDAGYTDVVVAGTDDSSVRWAGNRRLHALADLLGYGYVTPRGREYDVVDLGEDLVSAPFPPGSVLAGTTLGRGWVEAGYRIVVASNRTDEADGYALGLHTALRALPDVDDDLVYRHLADPGEVVAALLAATPVHLTVIDGVVSCHGSGGGRAPQALATDCLIAARDPWLADVVGALKMGQDPAVSRLHRGGPPVQDLLAGRTIIGSLLPHPGWRNPDPAVLDAVRARERSLWWSRLVRPWLQMLDTAAFPLESPLDAKLNAHLSGQVAELDDDPVARSCYVAASHAIGVVADAAQAYRTLYAKDALTRRHAPLDFDPDAHTTGDYEAVAVEIEGLARLLDGAPACAPGLRWRHLDEAVLFRYDRDLPMAFEEVVAAVDVATAISVMDDYLGGVVVVVEADAQGRPRRQAERNLYLPQPGWVALLGGQPIDVSKIELVEYHEDRHRLSWKTVGSANASARADDGSVTFERTAGGTAVRIVGRQHFVLPPALQLIGEGMPPQLRARLVTDAYRTFFDRTLANIEARTEGRDVRIGRTPADLRAPMPSVRIERLVEDAVGWVAQLAGDLRAGRPAAAVGEVDADGFRHFTAPPDQQEEIPGLAALGELADVWAGTWSAMLADAADLVRTEPR